jgi:hypothetical protein
VPKLCSAVWAACPRLLRRSSTRIPSLPIVCMATPAVVGGLRTTKQRAAARRRRRSGSPAHSTFLWPVIEMLSTGNKLLPMRAVARPLEAEQVLGACGSPSQPRDASCWRAELYIRTAGTTTDVAQRALDVARCTPTRCALRCCRRSRAPRSIRTSIRLHSGRGGRAARTRANAAAEIAYISASSYFEFWAQAGYCASTELKTRWIIGAEFDWNYVYYTAYRS